MSAPQFSTLPVKTLVKILMTLEAFSNGIIAGIFLYAAIERGDANFRALIERIGKGGKLPENVFDFRKAQNARH